jgi:mTERF domain-containing protein
MEDSMRRSTSSAPAASPEPRHSRKISHVKSPTNPDAVLTFLAGVGLSSTDVAAVVAKDPKILCSAMEKTLSPVVTGLAGLGLTTDEITLLISLAPRIFRYRSIVAKTHYYPAHLRLIRQLPPGIQVRVYLSLVRP